MELIPIDEVIKRLDYLRRETYGVESSTQSAWQDKG
jgi:hypothetical protein